jgi:hypothetical protein
MEGPAADAQRAGLCASCRHARAIENDRGSRFYLCDRSRTDDRFPRYPRLPVTVCVGYTATGVEPAS